MTCLHLSGKGQCVNMWKQTGETLPEWKYEPTDRPTSFMMTTKFLGITVIKIGNENRLSKALNLEQKASLLALVNQTVLAFKGTTGLEARKKMVRKNDIGEYPRVKKMSFIGCRSKNCSQVSKFLILDRRTIQRSLFSHVELKNDCGLTAKAVSLLPQIPIFFRIS